MFLAADRSPILLKTQSIEVDEIMVGIDQAELPEEKSFLVSSFSNDGFFSIKSSQIHDITVYNLKGQLILNKRNQNGDYQIELNGPKGIYFITFFTETGVALTK